MFYKLSLQTSPERVTHELLASTRAKVEAAQALDACEIIIWSDPNELPWNDLDDLREVIEEGGATQQQYLAFCLEQHLDAATDLAAGHFLEFLWGRQVVLLGMPRDESQAREALSELSSIAASLKLEIHDPQLNLRKQMRHSSVPGAQL